MGIFSHQFSHPSFPTDTHRCLKRQNRVVSVYKQTCLPITVPITHYLLALKITFLAIQTMS